MLGIVILLIIIYTIHCCYDRYKQEEQYVQIDKGTEEDRKEVEDIKKDGSLFKLNKPTLSKRSGKY